jgi:methylthioribose-1-phosphate isomerase
VNDGPSTHRTIWQTEDPGTIEIIDQRWLPHREETARLRTLADGVAAIRDMLVRGAPLIGATAAWTLYLAAYRAAERHEVFGPAAFESAARALLDARPTAVNLAWAVARMRGVFGGAAHGESRPDAALLGALREEAQRICDEDARTNLAIGRHGLALLRELHARAPDRPVNVLTHCNAGWLATVDWGTATAPVYLAHREGLPLHVWVDETRPRNQGAQLTAWELGRAGVPHTVIVDNAGGHLMQRGQVDVCIVGTDRVTRRGDVCNKIGTYLKALAAFDNAVPFYVALPSSTIDWSIADGMREVPIEERGGEEVTDVQGLVDGVVRSVRVTPPGSSAANPAFDVTPARLVTGLITERGVVAADEAALARLFARAVAAAGGPTEAAG